MILNKLLGLNDTHCKTVGWVESAGRKKMIEYSYLSLNTFLSRYLFTFGVHQPTDYKCREKSQIICKIKLIFLSADKPAYYLMKDEFMMALFSRWGVPYRLCNIINNCTLKIKIHVFNMSCI